MIDIVSFAIFEFSDTFIKIFYQHDILFKSQYILESLASNNLVFTFNLVHDNDNNVPGMVLITSYIHDNFERFGNYIFIDRIHSSIFHTKEFCYIAHVVNNEIGK